MRKVAVIEPGQREHPGSVEADGHAHGNWTGADDEDQETGGVERGEEPHARPVDALLLVTRAQRDGIIELRVEEIRARTRVQEAASVTSHHVKRGCGLQVHAEGPIPLRQSTRTFYER